MSISVNSLIFFPEKSCQLVTFISSLSILSLIPHIDGLNKITKSNQAISGMKMFISIMNSISFENR